MDTDVEGLLVDAFAQLGIEVRPLEGAPARGVDLVLDPDGVATRVRVKHRSLVTDDVAARLLADAGPEGDAVLIVADRVTESARKVLTSERGGYLDLRGRLAIRSDRLVVDADVEPVGLRAQRSDALSGKAGLEVATAILMRPNRSVAVRELARELGRSPSTVSETLAALRRGGLTDGSNAVLDTDLFWRVADRWPSRRTLLANLPSTGEATLAQPLRLGLDDVGESGWALTDSAAAAAYGAPLAFRSGQTLDFFVPDQSTVRRATTLLGAATSPSDARASVRVAPVPAVVMNRVATDNHASEWPLAQPLFVALDLAQDLGRGREILDAWTPDDRWIRVW
ncbi:helix-turn-helix domain-containing protein [Occultella kanbiaonis]|uniref:helix-turn-helix domain-containing protein n=1 Tax=Occultella kanbiaonis TaxID=2675754 RepID=UPI0013D77DC5|nr:helix-turn-helix domain-containing protein [Occultella kanbiaonis]